MNSTATTSTTRAWASSAAASSRRRPAARGRSRCGQCRAERKRAVATYFNRSFPITIQGACQSYRGNYLDLDPTYRDAYGLPLLRMTFDRRENETKMSLWLTNKAAEIAKAIGPSKMNVAPRTEKYTIVPYQSTHNTGGAIMGADPATSAVNKYLQRLGRAECLRGRRERLPAERRLQP